MGNVDVSVEPVAQSPVVWDYFRAFGEYLAVKLHEYLGGLRIGRGGGLVDEEHAGVDEVFDGVAQYLQRPALL